MANVDQAKKKKGNEDRASRPESTAKIELHTIQAQRVFDRNFSIINAHLYQILVMPMVYQQEDVAETALKEVQGKLGKIAEDMKGEIERIEKLKSDNGITLPINYSNPKVLEATITTPSAFTFLQMVIELDNLIKGLDMLWMGGVIDDKQKSEAAYQWQRRLIKFAGQIRQLEGLIRKGLKKKLEDNKATTKTSTTKAEPAKEKEKEKEATEATPKVAATSKVAMA